ncbi:helix-turn-helix domain-containing protein [Rothia kristinae]|uniref:helix-turn-helix domain-containing protein n=1 Tax=Rothia kristinae TaxID=37923 RepID=UPI00349F6627
MDAAVLATEPTLGVLKVWTVVANQLLGYGRTGDALTHGRIASEAGVTRETVRRSLNRLKESGVLTYRAGFGDPGAGRNTFSRLAIVLPKETPPVSGGPSDESEGDPSDAWGETPPTSGGRPLRRVGTPPSGQRGPDPSRERRRTPLARGVTGRGQPKRACPRADKRERTAGSGRGRLSL